MKIIFSIGLTFSESVSSDMKTIMLDWAGGPRVPKLEILRAWIEDDQNFGSLGLDWRFKNAGGVVLDTESEASYALTRYYTEKDKEKFDNLINPPTDANGNAKPAPDEVDAPELNIALYTPNAAEAPIISAESQLKTRVSLVLDDLTTPLQFSKLAPPVISLDVIRTQVNETEGTKLPSAFKFLNADGKAIEAKDEKTTMLPSLDPDATADGGGWGVYTLKVWSKDAVPGTKWDGTIPEPPTLIQLPNLAEPTPVNDSIPELPPFPDFDKDTKIDNWFNLKQPMKLKIAKEIASLYFAFNLPAMKPGKFEESRESKLAPTPSLILGKEVLAPAKKSKIAGEIMDRDIYNIDSGYSRREVDIKRSLQVTTSLGVSYESVAGAEAEFSLARAFNSNRVDENYFFYCDVLVQKARLSLPFKDSVPDPTQLKAHPKFIRQFDKISNAADLFNLMSQYGTLIARKVTIGGTVQVTETKTITQDFEASSERIAWKVSAKGSHGPLTVNVSNEGKIDDELMRQSNNQFSRTNIETVGGVSAFSIAKNIPGWIGSLGDVSRWAPIKREDIVPVYMVMDAARRDRFVQLLNQGGKRFWENSSKLPQLKLIDYDWYLSFAETDIYGELD